MLDVGYALQFKHVVGQSNSVAQLSTGPPPAQHCFALATARLTSALNRQLVLLHPSSSVDNAVLQKMDDLKAHCDEAKTKFGWITKDGLPIICNVIQLYIYLTLCCTITCITKV